MPWNSPQAPFVSVSNTVAQSVRPLLASLGPTCKGPWKVKLWSLLKAAIQAPASDKGSFCLANREADLCVSGCTITLLLGGQVETASPNHFSMLERAVLMRAAPTEGLVLCARLPDCRWMDVRMIIGRESLWSLTHAHTHAAPNLAINTTAK